MQLFHCPSCHATLFFENRWCRACGQSVGFAPGLQAMLAVGPNDLPVDGDWRACAYRTQALGCHWLVAASEAEPFCRSCRLNRTIPDLSVDGNLALWRRLEEEKRRLVYSALRLDLPIQPQSAQVDGLAFDFLADADPSFSERGRVLTGHAQGLITINIAEADPVARERMRTDMDEPYRTILGHFRHESGHYYWDRLLRDGPSLERFRQRFGDERADYAAGLQRNYEQGPPANWQERFVSAYASCHPWEDWAETWSHYLHMVDTLETAWAYGLRLDPRSARHDFLDAAPEFDPYIERDFDRLVGNWLPLSVALNSLNRSMGQEDAYPFVLASAVIDKLSFVHGIVDASRGLDDPSTGSR